MKIFMVSGHRKYIEMSYEDVIASIGADRIPELEQAAEANKKADMSPPHEYHEGVQVFASVANEAGEVFIPIMEDNDAERV